MKILSTLLLALLLLLTGQPPCTLLEKTGSSCCAEKDCAEGLPAEKDNTKKDCHGCNPFQACSCCAAAVILPAALPITGAFVPPAETPAWGADVEDCLLSRSADVWQPPRLG